MNKSRPIKINISNTILGQSRLVFTNSSGITNASDTVVITNTLLYFFHLKPENADLDNNGEDSIRSLVPSYNERNKVDNHNRKEVEIRIPHGLFLYINKISGKRDIDETIEQMLACVIRYLTKRNTPGISLFNIKNERLLKILGSKWDKRMQEGIENAFSGQHWTRSFELCCGALGIHANFNVADDEYIYDIDREKINLYKVIQKSPKALISELLSYDIAADTFEKIKDMHETEKEARIPNVKAAAHFLYLNLNSLKWDKQKFDSDATLDKYCKKLVQIHALHKRLKNTNITKKNIFESLKSIDAQDKPLLIIDPPYLSTAVYKDNIIGFEEHKELRKLIIKKRNQGADFIYFCRITAGHKKKNMTEEQLKKINENSVILERKIDDLYANQGLYYRDIALTMGIVERIITSFNYPEATPYQRS